MYEIIEVVGEFCFKLLLFFLIFFLCVLLISLPFLPDKSLTDDEEKKQIMCEHKWYEIDDLAFWVTIYCPACEKEQTIDKGEWNKIKVKTDYEQNHAVGK